VFDYIPFPVFTHTTRMTHFQFTVQQDFKTVQVHKIRVTVRNCYSWIWSAFNRRFL